MNQDNRSMEHCIFCQIAARRIPAKIVFEDEEVVAFEDTNPQAPVHTLIVPRKHLASLKDITPGDAPLLGRLLMVAAQLAREGPGTEGLPGRHQHGVRGGPIRVSPSCPPPWRARVPLASRLRKGCEAWREVPVGQINRPCHHQRESDKKHPPAPRPQSAPPRTARVARSPNRRRTRPGRYCAPGSQRHS